MNTELPPDDTKTGPLLGLGSSAVLGPSVPQPESAADEVARLVDKCNRYIVDNARLAENVDRLRAALRTAISTLERDGDEWNICEHLRAALGPNVISTTRPTP